MCFFIVLSLHSSVFCFIFLTLLILHLTLSGTPGQSFVNTSLRHLLHLSFALWKNGKTDRNSVHRNVTCTGKISHRKSRNYRKHRKQGRQFMRMDQRQPELPEAINALFKLVNPVFIKDGNNLKVSVSVKYLDNKSKMTQISQYELVLHKDDNWKIVE